MNLKEYLFTLKVQELKNICKKSNIIGVSKMKKSALVETMCECDLVGIPEGLVLDIPPTIPELIENEINPDAIACCHGSDDPECKDCEPIILHLPIKPDALKVSEDKWLNMFKKGKKILENGNAHTH